MIHYHIYVSHIQTVNTVRELCNITWKFAQKHRKKTTKCLAAVIVFDLSGF